MSRLGYERFGVQGGDWGAMASANMAELVPDRVIGLHLNLVTVPPPEVVPSLSTCTPAPYTWFTRESRVYLSIGSPAKWYNPSKSGCFSMMSPMTST